MRVVMLTSSYPLRRGAASGAFVAEMASHLAAAGHEVRVLVPADGESRVLDPTPGVDVRAVRYARPHGAQRLFHGAGLPDNLRRHPFLALLLPAALAALTRAVAIEARRADLLVSHWLLPSGLVAAAVSSRSGVPHLAIAHSGDVTLGARLLPRPLRRRFAALLDAGARRVVFTHGALRDRFTEAFGALHDAVVCPMGVDTPEQPRPPAPRDPNLPLRVLYVGRLEPLKGAALLLDTLQRLPFARATLAGDGSERTRLEHAAAALGGRVRLVGAVPRDDVRRLYADHDVLVVPSVVSALGRSEGVPHVALEAQAHGLPVVGSRVGGLAEAVADGQTGLLVPPGSGPALEAALTRLHRDRALLERLGLAAPRHAEAFAWPRVMARMGEGIW